MRPARRAGENIPAARPTRAPKPNDIPFEMRIAAGLRTHGRAAKLQAGFLLHAASRASTCVVRSVPMAWFVPIHRCGAAPDSHRIPYLAPVVVLGTAIGHKIWCLAHGVNVMCAARRAHGIRLCNCEKTLYNPRALPIRFARTRTSAWK